MRHERRVAGGLLLLGLTAIVAAAGRGTSESEPPYSPAACGDHSALRARQLDLPGPRGARRSNDLQGTVRRSGPPADVARASGAARVRPAWSRRAPADRRGADRGALGRLAVRARVRSVG